VLITTIKCFYVVYIFFQVGAFFCGSFIQPRFSGHAVASIFTSNTVSFTWNDEQRMEEFVILC
jgi:hypothetical protein